MTQHNEMRGGSYGARNGQWVSAVLAHAAEPRNELAPLYGFRTYLPTRRVTTP